MVAGKLRRLSLDAQKPPRAPTGTKAVCSEGLSKAKGLIRRGLFTCKPIAPPHPDRCTTDASGG
jgi:hypothetical protein